MRARKRCATLAGLRYPPSELLGDFFYPDYFSLVVAFWPGILQRVGNPHVCRGVVVRPLSAEVGCAIQSHGGSCVARRSAPGRHFAPMELA